VPKPNGAIKTFPISGEEKKTLPDAFIPPSLILIQAAAARANENA